MRLVFGVPQLPNIGSKMISRKTKIKMRKERGGRLNSSSKMISAKNSNSQGASDGTLLFSLGISIGMISSFLAKKREVDKLNELLRQTENLVQDLQEELEMKDSLTVKELVVEDYESQHTYNDSYNSEALQTFFPDQNLDESIIYNDKEFNDQKAKEESLLKIEAELEAEMENMKSSSFERKLTDLVELDPEFVPDIVDGELRADLLTRKASSQLHADRDVSGGSTAHSANHSVSPTELSLRLHQVLETTLEERIKELETELKSKQSVHYIESESVKSCSDFTNSESGSSTQEEQRIEEQPVVINLAGEGLDMYCEAYNEFADGLHPFDQYLLPSDQDCHSFGNGSASTASIHQKGGDRNTPLDDICSTSRDENGDGVDELEKVLIEQILEKTRKGFPAVLNAQGELFLLDQKTEH